MASSAPAPAAASASAAVSVSAAPSAGSAEYPQFDPTSLGLPADFLLYKYNALKG